MKVSAVIVTRGDVPLDEVLDSLPREWEKVVVSNDREAQDFKVYGRYIGALRAENDLIYVQDDDVIVGMPELIVQAWWAEAETMKERVQEEWMTVPQHFHHVVCNMPSEFRHDFYRHHALVGFGAVFHRGIVEPTFKRYLGATGYMTRMLNDEFLRTCDIPFTALNPRVLVDVPKRNLEWCDAPNRMWKQDTHQGERSRVLDRCLQLLPRAGDAA